MKPLRTIALSASLPLGVLHAQVAPTLQDWEQCAQQSAPQQAECFATLSARLAATRPVAPTPAATGAAVASADAPAPAAPVPRSFLSELWPGNRPASRAVLQPYRSNYAIATYTNQPNNRPTSGNPENRFTPAAPYDNREVKLQLSFKVPAFGNDTHSVWFGYTQQSHWQVFDGAQSRPFRTHTFEPEGIYSFRFASAGDTGLALRFLNFGISHQSNGQSKPFSRSWNRVYAQLGAEYLAPGGHSLALTVKPWYRFKERAETDDNPDLTHYIGHGELEFRFGWPRVLSFTTLLRKRSAQFDLAFPLRIDGRCPMALHMQYFNGFAETLVDYNHRHQTFGLGVSLPFGQLGNGC